MRDGRPAGRSHIRDAVIPAALRPMRASPAAEQARSRTQIARFGVGVGQPSRRLGNRAYRRFARDLVTTIGDGSFCCPELAQPGAAFGCFSSEHVVGLGSEGGGALDNGGYLRVCRHAGHRRLQVRRLRSCCRAPQAATTGTAGVQTRIPYPRSSMLQRA